MERLGVGVFGAEAAAKHYYGVPAANLGQAQAARMAVMLPRPRFYDRNRGPAVASARGNSVRRRQGGETACIRRAITAARRARFAA